MSTAKAKVKVGFIGDMTGAACSELKELFDLQSYEDNVNQSLAGIIYDASAGEQFEAAYITGVLDSGRSLAIINAGQQLLDTLAGIVGTPLSPGPGLIVCAKGEDGSYGAEQIWAESGNGVSISAEDGSVQSTEGSAATRVEWGPAIEAAFSNERPSEERASGVPIEAAAAAVPGLIPPIGATFGIRSGRPWPLKWQWAGPIVNGSPDDKTAGRNIQFFKGQHNREFYVYYVDGVSPAYYVVIMKHTGQFSPGQMLANSQNSVGYFQYGLNLTANPLQQDGSPFGNGVTLSDYSPKNFVGESVPVSIDVPMEIKLKLGQESGNTAQFNATEQKSTFLHQWAVQDQTVQNPCWFFHQSDVWDPSQNQPADYPNWWRLVYQNNGEGGGSPVKAMPNLSYSTLSYETIAAWTFDPSLIRDPKTRSLRVQFHTQWKQQVAFIHNADGCNIGHHQMFTGYWYWNWTSTVFDLASVAVPTGPR